MLDKSFFVSSKIHEKEVVLGDGSAHILHFKELPAVEYAKFYNAQNSADEDVQAGAAAKLISASLCDVDGNQVIKYDDALKLRAEPMNAMFVAIMEVNKTEGKGELTAKSGFGTS